ncbi:hypothetical protein UF75_1512 [Desulfosporosinus sp. I2]|nr:hypothetical protein UF75_1512 [Desulfosporosinus sp. I2]
MKGKAACISGNIKLLFMFTLSEDLELKKIERIVTAPVSFGKYLLSHLEGKFGSMSNLYIIYK